MSKRTFEYIPKEKGKRNLYRNLSLIRARKSLQKPGSNWRMHVEMASVFRMEKKERKMMTEKIIQQFNKFTETVDDEIR